MAVQDWKQIGAYRGVVHPSVDFAAVAEDLARISDLLESPGAVTLQAGRHRTVRLTGFGTSSASSDVVVKAFGRQSALKDAWDSIFGTKAFRTFDTAAFLTAAGIGTIRPVAVLERWEGRRLAESYFVSAYLADTVCFRDRLEELFRTDAGYAAFERLFDIVADGVRQLHDSGCAHGDLGNQNIEILNLDSPDRAPLCVYLDLNRASCGAGLSACARARDLVRIWMPPIFRASFFRRYWKGSVPLSFRMWFSFWRFLFRFHTRTRKLRHPLRELKYRLHPELSPSRTEYPTGAKLREWQGRIIREMQD